MGFRELFKVRQPGNGKAFEERVKSASAASKRVKFPTKGGDKNSGAKKEVGIK